MVKKDTLPSASAIKIEAVIGEELKAKVVQAAAAKWRKAAKKEGGGVKAEAKDEFDEMADDKQGVRQRIASGDKSKQTKISFKPVKKKVETNPVLVGT